MQLEKHFGLEIGQAELEYDGFERSLELASVLSEVLVVAFAKHVFVGL